MSNEGLSDVHFARDWQFSGTRLVINSYRRRKWLARTDCGLEFPLRRRDFVSQLAGQMHEQVIRISVNHHCQRICRNKSMS